MTTAAENPPSPAAVEYFFDPACPWTWLTSRWLVDAARQRDTAITWRSLSLAVINEGNVPEQYAVPVAAAAQAHRLLAALGDAGRNDLVGDVYTAIGTRVHDGGRDLTDDLVREAAAAAGAGEWAKPSTTTPGTQTVRASTSRGARPGGPRRRLAGHRPRVAAGRPCSAPSSTRGPGARRAPACSTWCSGGRGGRRVLRAEAGPVGGPAACPLPASGG